jgi:hypothetical protein
MGMRTRATVLAMLAAGLVLPAGAARADFRTGVAQTFLLSRADDGGMPNAPSADPDVSQDERLATLVAYQSDASNIVAGDTNGTTDVFAVHRAAGYGDNGTEWDIGATDLVSAGMSGQPANGPSWAARVDGAPGVAPHCVAFLSNASNLVPGDTNGKTDAFVRDLASGKTTRVSVNSKGQQQNGDATAVQIDSDCTRVAFASDATNLAFTKTKSRFAKPLVTKKPRGGTSQVYVHVISGRQGESQELNGITYLASANSKGVPGNGNSLQPAFAKLRGRAVAFTSTATNLAKGGGNGKSQIYVRWMLNPAKEKFTTQLVSVNGKGQAGNAPSADPVISGVGTIVSYQTDATNLLPGDTNGMTDIAEATLAGKKFKQVWASRGDSGEGNGASFNPSMTYSGHFVSFDSNSTNFTPARFETGDTNNVADAFFSMTLAQRVYEVSQSSEGLQLDYPSAATATSARGNYILFEASDSLTDLSFLADRYPGLLGPAASEVGLLGQLTKRAGGAIPVPLPKLPPQNEIYMRYLGPQ